jgi:hypothetical protein
MKKPGKSWGRKEVLFLCVIAIGTICGFGLAGCGDPDSADSSSPPNNSPGTNTPGTNNPGGNNGDGDNKTFSFKVKNEANGYTISRIYVAVGNSGNITDRKNLDISYGSSSETFSKTLTDGWTSLGVRVYYDDDYPSIYAGIDVETDWPSSFTLRLWKDGGTIKLSRM